MTVTRLARSRLCRLVEELPFPKPPAAPLPDLRIELSPSFRNIRIDHLGPFYFKSNGKKDEFEKCYVALVTCASSRAIHLELQPDLRSPALIRCLQRTFARRGVPKLVVSDNHKTFRSKKVKAFAAQLGVT